MTSPPKPENEFAYRLPRLLINMKQRNGNREASLWEVGGGRRRCENLKGAGPVGYVASEIEVRRTWLSGGRHLPVGAHDHSSTPRASLPFVGLGSNHPFITSQLTRKRTPMAFTLRLQQVRDSAVLNTIECIQLGFYRQRN